MSSCEIYLIGLGIRLAILPFRPCYSPFNATPYPSALVSLLQCCSSALVPPLQCYSLFQNTVAPPHRQTYQHMGSIKGTEPSPCTPSYVDRIEGPEASPNENAVKACASFWRVVLLRPQEGLVTRRPKLAVRLKSAIFKRNLKKKLKKKSRHRCS